MADSSVSPKLYKEVEGIVQEILNNSKEYPSRKSISTYSAYLKELANAMSGHCAKSLLLEIRSKLMEHCKQNNRSSITPDEIYERLSQLLEMVDWSLSDEKNRFPLKTIKYNKLVRDLIPDIIVASGKTCTTSVLSDADYIAMLDAKLNEELAEYQESKSMEELADLLEVIRAVAAARGSSIDEVERIRQDKAAKRGGFEKRLLLTEVRSEE